MFAFLPMVVFGFFSLNRYLKGELPLIFLTIASLFFYTYYQPAYLLILLASILFNYRLGKIIAAASIRKDKNAFGILTFAVAVNCLALGYYKYADFFIENVNFLGASLTLVHVTLPLAISFFTFQQIAYLIDSYRGLTKEYNFSRYALFVSFFPQLVAGPIVHHSEMMPQFADREAQTLDWNNIFKGICLFVIGLFKKVIIADTFAMVATSGFDTASGTLGFGEAWCSTLSYTLQIYFDFSGYTDMAIGAALMLGIRLPLNFNSPYKAVDIQDFWRRWHMTLSRWLRDYVYIPLGGSRQSYTHTMRNIFLTFLIGGIWHGAGWGFVIWGILHGMASCIFRLWQRLQITLPKQLSWLITFLFVSIGWVFFRATSMDSAIKIFKGLSGQNGYGLGMESWHAFRVSSGDWINVALGLLMVIFAKNSNQLIKRLNPTTGLLLLASIVFITAVYNLTGYSEFIYFNF